MSGRMRAVGFVLVGVAGLALLVAILNPGAAEASGEHVSISIVGGDQGFTTHPAGALVDTKGLVPGRSVSGTMGVRSDFAESSELRIQLVEVADDDNGCAPAEAAVDRTCGRDQGELGAALVCTLDVATSEDGTYRPTWTGSATQLAQGVPAAEGIAAGETRWVRLTVNLPFSSGNETQTDTYGFGVQVIVQTTSGTGGVEIGGGNGSAGGPGGGAGNGSAGSARGGSGNGVAGASGNQTGLAFTGTQIVLLISTGALLIAGGLVLVAGARIRRRDAAG